MAAVLIQTPKPWGSAHADSQVTDINSKTGFCQWCIMPWMLNKPQRHGIIDFVDLGAIQFISVLSSSRPTQQFRAGVKRPF